MADHPHFRLGARAPRRDPRTFAFAELLRAAPKVPAEYDFDLAHPGVPLPMFANDTYGDCVNTARQRRWVLFDKLSELLARLDSVKEAPRG